MRLSDSLAELQQRYADYQAEIAGTRLDLLTDPFVPYRRQCLEALRRAEVSLDRVGQQFDSEAARGEVRASLQEARKQIDEVRHRLAKANRYLQVGVVAWMFLLLLGTFGASLNLYSSTHTPPPLIARLLATPNPSPAAGRAPASNPPAPAARDADTLLWQRLRPLLIAACGGAVGACIGQLLAFCYALANRQFRPGRTVWYFASPVIGAILAAAAMLLITSGILPINLPGAAAGAPLPTSAAAVTFAVGFLVGFAPDSVEYRLRSIIRAFFGTDEVRAPRVSAPSGKQRNDQFEISAEISASGATYVTSANALITLPDRAPATVPLSQTEGRTYTGRYSIPEGLADLSTATVVVEARDEAGNTGRSVPVTLLASLRGASDAAETTPAGLMACSVPPDGTLPAGQEIALTFSRPVVDADVALTGPEDKPVTVTRQWNAEKTRLTVLPAHPLTPGAEYRLTVEHVELPGEERTDEDFDRRFQAGR